MGDLVRRLSLRDPTTRARALQQEWLLTNGLGGFASGTVSGLLTSRHHGYLVAALGAPVGRAMVLNHLLEHAQWGVGRLHGIGGGAEPEAEEAEGLVEFRLECGLPIWRYELEEGILEKRVLLPRMQNTVQVTYRLLHGQAGLRLRLRPSMHFRPVDAQMSETLRGEYVFSILRGRFTVDGVPGFPTLHILLLGERPTFSAGEDTTWEAFYRDEAERGYDSRGMLWTPGTFSLDLPPGSEASLVASTEPWPIPSALPPDSAQQAERHRRRRLLTAAAPPVRTGVGAELVLAADQFLITPVGRSADVVCARAMGDEVRAVIAGYHWFADWGRDTMIVLEGLTLVTGRHVEAGWILRAYARYVRDGLIPNLFPEGENEGLYHTADATLWYFHALDRYLQATDDRATLQFALPKLLDILEHHLKGTRFGIAVDPADGLLTQGAPGFQLTWMDAKVEDWVVTPRRGKAVEINALWYNALCLMVEWLEKERGEAFARPYRELADRVREAFNRRFWYAEGGYCYDVVDGEHGHDAALRPNQLLAISLPHPVLDPARWAAVVGVAQEKLLTPLGLRSLAPGHPDFKPKYFGDLRSRDAAYHQGTVWAWLIGPFVDAFLRVHPDARKEARGFLEAFGASLGDRCLGSLSEIFDAESPFTPRGCIAQAWSVAEVLRCLAKTAES